MGRSPGARGTLLGTLLIFAMGSFAAADSVSVAPALLNTLLARQAGSSNASTDTLEKILSSMDTAAANFRALQANFVWLQYTKVVDDKDYQKGTIYYRRQAQGKGIEMMADIVDPSPKAVLYHDGKVRVAQPNVGVTPYDPGKNREAVESFLVLGFGGSGRDLEKQFDVKYDGDETIDGVKTAKLVLTPKSEGVKKVFDRILLWIDPARGVSLQQEFFEPNSGNYRLATYTNIQLKQKLDDNVFRLPNYPAKKIAPGN